MLQSSRYTPPLSLQRKSVQVYIVERTNVSKVSNLIFRGWGMYKNIQCVLEVFEQKEAGFRSSNPAQPCWMATNYGLQCDSITEMPQMPCVDTFQSWNIASLSTLKNKHRSLTRMTCAPQCFGHLSLINASSGTRCPASATPV